MGRVVPFTATPTGEPRPITVALPPTPELTDSQRRVLLAAVEVFAARGFGAASVRDIAAVAGVQSASLYKHFPSKEVMLAELLLLGHTDHQARLMAAVVGAGGTPAEQVRAIVRAHVLCHCAYPDLGLVVNHELVHVPEELLAPILTVRNQSAGLLAEVLRRGVEVGDFSLLHAEATVAAIGSMGQAVAAWFPQSAADLSAEELAEVYAGLALRMVGHAS